MVTVVVTTYNPTPDAPRYQYLAHCIDSFNRRLHGPEDMDLLITDDGSPYPGPLNVLVQPVPRAFAHAGWITGDHGGIGRSLNRALSLMHEPWMYTTDDWVLTEPLDLALPLWLLDQGYDLVRLGPMHPDVRCTTNFRQGHGWWLDIDVWSAQYSCGTRPFLAAPSLMRKVGPWTEGVDSYQAEKDFCSSCQMNDVSAASINIHGPWETIGDGYPVGNLPVIVAPAFSGEKGA